MFDNSLDFFGMIWNGARTKFNLRDWKQRPEKALNSAKPLVEPIC